ncbi:MAG: L-threonylcarbamoyladenylate synthase, partial [Alphaproteobacteria bacterium]|nr:L-threonylcarbamoyladenylate synthase [Alphaproteobacteria bacterium]
MDSVTSLQTDRQALGSAAKALRCGRLVAFPTETVYGLGAAATDDRAVARIFEAKARPRFNPLIVHVTDRHAAAAIAEWSELADRLAARFWPGPLTLVLRRKRESDISMLASAGGETIALRAPAHPLAQALLTEAGLPIAAPSANRAGRISPTTADHVRRGLGDRVDLILDGGACPVGVESTVLDVTTDDRPRLLRPGGLARTEIEAVIGETQDADDGQIAEGRAIRSPGQLASHYAPRQPLRLDAEKVAADEALLAFGPEPLEGALITANLSKSGDLTEAAANLFAMLHQLDRQDVAG